MKQLASFLAVMGAVLAGVVWLLTRAVPGEVAARSFWVSATAVVVVQTITFSLLRFMQPVNVMAGYAMGFILRILAIVLFGFFGVPGFGLSLQPALLGMAGFFFISTLIEPFFLKAKD